MSSKQQRRLGPSRTGTTHFWHQRLTAIALIPLTLFFVGLLPNLAGATHREFVTLIHFPVTPILLVLLVGVGLWHMKLGLQTIIEDYVHGEGCKLALQITMTFGTVLLGVAGVIALVMLAAMPPA